MFHVRFELKKRLRIMSEHAEHEKQLFGGFKASPWRKTALKYKFPHISRLRTDFLDASKKASESFQKASKSIPIDSLNSKKTFYILLKVCGDP